MTGVRIPIGSLPPATLRRLVEEFVSREGTEYGPVDHTLESKIATVLKQLQRGDASIVFDPETETTNIIPTE